MRERLIQLLQEAEGQAAYYDGDDAYGVAADYLLDNSVIVLPACVGQTVWIVSEYEVLEDIVFEIDYGTTQSGAMKWLFLVEDSGEDFYDTDIGKTVFLTREDAERALEVISKSEISTGTDSKNKPLPDNVSEKIMMHFTEVE